MDASGDEGLYVPLINAEQPGQGAVGRYLDSLPRDQRVVFPNVLSAVLAGMLHRRGFALTDEYSPEFEARIPCWERKALPLFNTEVFNVTRD